MPTKKTLNFESVNKLAKQMKLNPLALPQVVKTSISVGLGQNKENKEIVKSIENEIALVTGQKPKFTRAKKSISGFKLREGQHIGFVVTLRGKRMWQFLEKLTSVVLPRVRDFDGINDKSIDKNGNLSFSLMEQVVFPEIKPDETKGIWGMTITLTLSKKAEKAFAIKYYSSIGLIFLRKV